ncbi:MAG: hypothetical protein RL757_936 [Bacteroidota bacterium]|jgi:hypothetical protein
MKIKNDFVCNKLFLRKKIISIGKMEKTEKEI